jgi:hypothetical protein
MKSDKARQAKNRAEWLHAFHLSDPDYVNACQEVDDITLDKAAMVYVKWASQLAARESQVKALRKIAKRLYEAIISGPPWSKEDQEAVRLYEKEMKK